MTKRSVLLLFFVLLKFALQYILINPAYDLQRDEFLHLDQANHLAWGYASVPPFTSWNSVIIKALGNSVFWIKFFPALYGCLSLILVWKLVEHLNGKLFALTLSALAFIFSAILRLNILYQPNSFDVLSWTALYYVLIRFVQTRDKKWLWLSGIVFAFGFLNKYNIGFMAAGLIPAFLITQERKIFLNKNLYIAGLIALVLISPNLVWQYQNDFPVVTHMKELASTQLINVNRFVFLQSQVYFFIGSIFVIVIALISFFKYPRFRKFGFVFWSFLFTMILFLYFRAKDYYAIGLYPVLLAFGSVYIEYLLRNKRYRILKWAIAILPAIVFIPLIPYAFPVYPPEKIVAEKAKFQALGMNRWEDGKDHDLPQDFADMLGWKSIATATDSIYKTLSDKEHTLVLADNYGLAGAINYYSTDNNVRANSFNADYVHWFPRNLKIAQLLIVKERDNDESDDPEMKTEHALFGKVEFKWRLNNPYARENGAPIYLLSQPKTDINRLIEEKIKEEQ